MLCPISVCAHPQSRTAPPALLSAAVPTVNPGADQPGPCRNSLPATATGICPVPGGRERLTLGLLPPMAPGRMEPVSWYLQRILETQPWDTRSWREMTQGLMPWWAISTILCRIWLGKGLPLINTPPS